ncbi:hypothetical protein DR66_3770 [Delftia acidovorans]|uniref:SOS response-associated peptidase family protein n=1 Tax=Delftia acidovorans TaxID=80866 RepID=UPI000504E7B6|nr:SOS response-associated peptidase family protein [Delftia acidovorans]KFJ12921.1 hypothetical protein DR66_3770 [Delftia acidovorans]QQB53138.1 SOS response-associated peptidase family protein [Delftia acidovorans]
MGNRYVSPDIIDIDEIHPLQGVASKKGWGVYITPLSFGPYIKVCGSLEVGQWGMIPASSINKRPLSLNGSSISTEKASRETLSNHLVFGPSWQAGRRCLIPVSSWIENYSRLSNRSINWMFRRSDGMPAMLAGIYSEWFDPFSGEKIPNYAVITQNAEAHPVLSLMHRPGREKRCVVVLEQQDWDAWLHCTPVQADSMIRLPAMGVLKSGAENPIEEGLLSLEQLRELKVCS